MAYFIRDEDEFRKAIIMDFRSELEAIKKQFQPKEPTQYLTVQEVAELLQIDRSTVFNWTKTGKLQKYGIGHRTYYKRAEVEAAIKPLNSSR